MQSEHLPRPILQKVVPGSSWSRDPWRWSFRSLGWVLKRTLVAGVMLWRVYWLPRKFASPQISSRADLLHV